MVNYQEGKIYKIVNNVNDIIYIGSTCQALSTRMSGHRRSAKVSKMPFYKATNTISFEHFKILLVKDFPCNSKAELEAEEYKTMKEFVAQGVELYNDFVGSMSVQQKLKLSEAHKGKVFTEETKEKISKATKGRVCSDETKEKMSKCQKGKVISNEVKEKMSEAHKGKVFSEEHKQTLSQSNVNKGKFQKDCVKFKYGSISYYQKENRISFSWVDAGIQKSNSFSCNKYGSHQALLLAYDKRKSVYPEWLTPEEETINELSMIEL